MGRVGHHHVGGRHVGHHAALGHLALQLADLGLDLRVAVGLLRFLDHFLAGHLQLIGVMPHLVWPVDGGDQAERADDEQEAAAEHIDQMDGTELERLDRQADHRVLLLHHHHVGDHADHQRLGDGLEQLDQRVLGEHVADAGDGVELAELGHEGLAAEQPAAHQQRRGQRNDHHGHAQRQAGDHHPHHVDQDAVDQHIGVEDLLLAQGQPGHQGGIELSYQAVAGQPQAGAGGHQHRKRGHFPRSGNVAFLARLLEALR